MLNSMSKVTNPAQNFKLAVEAYSECLNDGKLLCSCYTPGLQNEETGMEKEVTFQELINHVCDGNSSLVTVTHSDDSSETEQLTFWHWYGNLQYSAEMNDVLAEIINKREGRKELADMPDIFVALGAIINPFANKKTA